MSNTTIKIYRKSNIAAMLRKLDVMVDGKKIGNIGNGQTESFEVSAGPHTVQVKLFAKSESVDINSIPESTIELECGIAPQFWKRLVRLIAIVTLMYLFRSQLYYLGEFGHSAGSAEAVMLVAAIVFFASQFKPGGTYYLKKIDHN